jgi:hypothetical protein
MFDLDPEIRVNRVVLRLLRRTQNQTELEGIVESVSSRLVSVHAQLDLVDLVGHRPRVGAKLISPTAAQRIQEEVYERVLRASPGDLVKERHVLTLLARALEASLRDRAALDSALDDPQLFGAVLRDAVKEVRSQAIGELAINRTEVLWWDQLCLVLGDEEGVRRRLTLLDEGPLSSDQATRHAVELARTYLGGWRPEQVWPSFRPAVPVCTPDFVMTPPTGRWPDLVLRAASCFDPTGVQQRGIGIGPEFRRKFEEVLSSGSLNELFVDLGRYVDIQAGDPPWTPDSDAFQTTGAAVMIRSSGPADTRPGIQLRAGVLLPSSPSSRVIRVLVDVYLWRLKGTGADATDERASGRLLDLAFVLHVLATCLRAAAEDVPNVSFGELVGIGTPARTSVELHILAGRGGGPDNAPPRTLEDTIDLSPLGTSTRQAPTQGTFTAEGGTPLSGEHEPGDLALTALRQVALDWGYLDPDRGLPRLGSISG